MSKRHREYITVISPMWIKKELDKVVAGQDEAKKSLSILGYNHHLRLQGRVLSAHHVEIGASSKPNTPPRLTGLITGPTGTGKTYLVETLANLLGFPYLKIDATQIARHGFSGVSMDEYINALQEKYKGTIQADYLDTAIIFIDEIDKLGKKSTSTQSDDHNREIQNSLLTFVDGLKATRTSNRSAGEMDTTKMLFLFGGAFGDVYQQRLDKKQGLGFHGESKDKEKIYSENLSRDEIESGGVIRELLGRIHVITHTTKLSRSQIKEVMFSVRGNLVDQFQSIFNLSGVHMPDLTDNELDTILEKIEENEYGMRYVKTILFDHFKDQLFHLDCDMNAAIDASEVKANATTI